MRTLIFFVFCIIVGYYNYVVPFYFTIPQKGSTVFKNNEGRIQGIIPIKPQEEGEEIHTLLPIDSLNELTNEQISCILAAEDKTFYKPPFFFNRKIFNGRYSLPRLEDKSITNLRTGNFKGVPLTGLIRLFVFLGIKGGGSGIVQQLAKNLMHENWSRTLEQKYSETIMAMALSCSYTSDELLVMYLNNIPMYLNQKIDNGKNKLFEYADVTYGLKTAAVRYFSNSDIKSLSLDKFATLVATIKGGQYRVVDSIKTDIIPRRNNIFNRMVIENFITQSRGEQLKITNTVFNLAYKKHECFSNGISFAKKQAIEILKNIPGADITLNGYKITTTYDKGVQVAASDAVDTLFKNLDKTNIQTGISIINPTNGYILALIGDNMPYNNTSSFNYATVGSNEIGSTIKPFVYGAFFNKGYGINTLLFDGNNDTIDGYNPPNFSGTCSNNMLPAIYCLANSINKPTANIVNTYLNTTEVISFMRNCGFVKSISTYKPMVLGSDDFTPLAMSQAYCVFANGGNKVPAIAVTEIRDATNKIIWSIKSATLNESFKVVPNVISSNVAKQVFTCLREVVKTGTAAQLNSFENNGITIAGKTGTSNDAKDTWFIGLRPQYVTAIWIGDANNKALPEKYGAGSKLCVPLYAQFVNNLKGKFASNVWPYTNEVTPQATIPLSTPKVTAMVKPSIIPKPAPKSAPKPAPKLAPKPKVDTKKETKFKPKEKIKPKVVTIKIKTNTKVKSKPVINKKK